MTHAIIAALLQAAIGITTGNWWVGAVLGCAFYAGREHAQAEYRWIEHHGSGRRANMPWWGGFDPKVWNLKSCLDWLAPVSVTFTLALVVQP